MGKKKIISLIVSVAMLVAMFPMIVHADGESLSFSDVQEMLDTAGYAQLTANCIAEDGEGSIVVPAEASWAIDLNGYTISGENSTRIFTVESGATLRIMNNSFYANDTVSNIVAGSADNGAGIMVEENGTLLLNPGITFSGNICTQNGGAIYNKGTVDIGDGVSFYGNVAPTGKGGAVYLAAGGTLRIGGDCEVDDIYLTKDTLINVIGYCTKAKIGVSLEKAPTENAPVVFTSGLGQYGSETNFTSKDGYTVALNGDGELQMKGTGSGIQEDPVKLKGCTVTLGGMLGVNIFVDFGTLDDSVKEASTVTVTISGKGGKEQVYSYADGFDGEIQGANYHGYTYEISSIQMADEITVIVSYDGQTTEFAPFTVESYIDAMYRNFQSYGLTNEQYLLIRRFNDYGYYVQKYLDSINEGWSISAGDHTAMTAPYFSYNSGLYDYVVNATNDTASVTYQPIKVVDENSKITKVTYSLEFGTTIALEIFFTVEAGTEFSASATCASTGKTYRAYLADDGRYKIRISGILVQELGNMFVSVTGTAGSDFTLDVHPFGYINKAVKSSSTLKKDAMTALYFFYDAANSAN